MQKREVLQEGSIRQYIITAFRELLVEKPYEKIKVQHIADRAGISRTTFYLHFQDKENLLHVVTEDLLNELVSYYHQSPDNQDRHSPIDYTTRFLCEHIERNIDFYKERIQDEAFVELLFRHLYEALQVSMQNDALSTFAAYGTIGYLKRWIQMDCRKPVKEVATGLRDIGEAHFERLVGSEA